jgi:glutamyl-tRNA synthetase
MTLPELTSAFSLEGVNRSNAVVNFSEEDPIDPKALWLNSQHLRTVPVKELLEPVLATLAQAKLSAPEDEKQFAFIVDTIRTRFNTLLDFSTKGRAYFSDDFPMDSGSLAKLNAPGARELLRELAEKIAAGPVFTEASVEADLRKLAEERAVKAGLLINASRAALTGQPVGPSAFAVFLCLGRERVVSRLRNV